MEWAPFTRRTNIPKLDDLQNRLDKKGIPNRLNGRTNEALILEVAKDRLDDAWAILDEEVDCDGGRVKYDDIPDDHPMFALDTKAMMKEMLRPLVKPTYPDGNCPDCGEEIPDTARDGDNCDDCGNTLWTNEA